MPKHFNHSNHSNLWTWEVEFLGTGTSTGIPVIGCLCKVCQSTDLKDKRLRSSVVITFTEKQSKTSLKVLVDPSPDFRTQILRAGITSLDLVIITHEHADHVHGIDDLRQLSTFQKKHLPVLTSQTCAKALQVRFPYIFDPQIVKIGTKSSGGLPQLTLHEVGPSEESNLISYLSLTHQEAGLPPLIAHWFLLPHGRMTTLGFFIEKLVYLIDFQHLPKLVADKLESLSKELPKGLDLMIIDCVQDSVHGTHLDYPQALQILEQFRPQQAALIHMGHAFSHQELSKRLEKTPQWVASYDQLRLKNSPL